MRRIQDHRDPEALFQCLFSRRHIVSTSYPRSFPLRFGMRIAVRAIETGQQARERTLVELRSYPSLDELADKTRSSAR
jgi:hypothetical protein